MSNDLPALTSLTENSTNRDVSAGQVENYVLLLVLLSVFAGGTLVLLSLLLLFCHRCCLGGRRYSRASDDLEKTNTTYAEDSQPTQEITIRLDESDALSASSCPDGESERFVSTGRRVSFNESALYEQEKGTQEKGRRYTLTEGDFHHLKKARLTHLHLSPAPCDLKILTIMECDSAESSSINICETAAPLTIYQPAERRLPDWMGQSLSGGLPGDPHHSTVLDQGRRLSSSTMEAFRDGGEAESDRGPRGESTQALGQTSVLRFFSKLRRHASLEGAGPYFRRWKFDTSHRAASLDAKGSPRRKPFQRQRAASETTDHTDEDSSPFRDDAFESFPHTPIQTSGLQSLSAESLSRPSSTSSSSVFLRRLKLEAMVEAGGSISTRREESAARQEEATINGMGAEQETTFSTKGSSEAAGDELESTEDDDLFGSEQNAAMQERFEDLLRKTEDTKADNSRADVREEVDDGEEVVQGAEARQRTDSGSSASFMIRQESSEPPHSLYRDIWSLRASLEQYAASDQSSTDRESIRSDADSVSSFGGAGARSGLDSCLSQDLDDEPEGDGEAEESEGVPRGASGVDSEMGGGTGGDGEGGNRKLLQMDSGYASIEAPSRAPEEVRLFGAPGAPRGKSASERRLFFTSSGRKGTVCESIEARLFQEELEDQMMDCNGVEDKQQQKPLSQILQEPCHLLKSLQPQKAPESQPQMGSPLMKPAQPTSPHRSRLRRRDYSIDEKTDALFNEFLRHDPRFDQQDSPLRSRHRSRVHLRKQWQRHKQYSDPGSASGGRYSPSLERQRFSPLRRGDSAGYPLDTRYHSTLSRIASAADEEASEVAACEEAAKERAEVKDQSGEGAAGNSGGTRGEDTESTSNQSAREGTAHKSHMDPRVDNRNNNSSQAILSEISLQEESSLTNKLVASVEERLYGSLRRSEKPDQAEPEHVLTVSHTASPGFSPT
uniref:Chromosome 19 open reading frame 26 n=1 Tax=Nothobranchius pienaari TaxID=704102 RepID=A0A1A8NFI3_9TELE